MAAIVTNEFRIFNARQLVESVSESAPSNVYLFVGRPQGWTDDEDPPTPLDTTQAQYEWNNDMIALKRVTSDNVSYVIPRRDWTSGTIYDEYSHDISSLNPTYSGATDKADATYIVMTEEYRVYKCLFNNGNVASTVKPTSTSGSPFFTLDGYCWLYLYTIDVTTRTKFLTPDFMPVMSSFVSNVDGAVNYIKIISGGAGYGSAPTIALDGDGSGFEGTVVLSDDEVANVTITNPGYGYRFANVTFSGGSPTTTATAKAIISPYGGHGTDTVSELDAFYVMMYTNLAYDEGNGDFPPSNQFRTVGLMLDPKNYGTNTISYATTMNATFSLACTSASGPFTEDEIILGGTSGAKGMLLTAPTPSSGAVTMRYIQPANQGANFKSFSTGETITGQTSGRTATISSIIAPEYKTDSGKIIYVEHRAPITRSLSNVESIHIVVEF